jgi:hypothetical protein
MIRINRMYHAPILGATLLKNALVLSAMLKVDDMTSDWSRSGRAAVSVPSAKMGEFVGVSVI